MQVQQWFFAAAPGHPALKRACDHIANSYKRKFSDYTNIDTLERTGPGAWTDVVVGTALQHSPGVREHHLLVLLQLSCCAQSGWATMFAL